MQQGNIDAITYAAFLGAKRAGLVPDGDGLRRLGQQRRRHGGRRAGGIGSAARLIAQAALAAGFGIDLATCDPEIREALYEELRGQGRQDRHAARMEKLRGPGG